MRYIPFEVLRTWPVPDYENPVTRGNALVIVNSIFITLVIIVVGLRLHIRLFVKRQLGVDDAFIGLALISAICLTTIVLLANQSYGWDRHVYDIPFSKLAPASKIALSAKIVFSAAATFTRLSLLSFYYRLVQDSGKELFVWAVHANVAYTIAIFITFLFLSIFLCTPVENYWTFGAPADSCLDEGTATLAAGVINCIADFLCTILPIPLVSGLHMPRRQRIAVIVLFSLGFVVTIAGIIRTWFIYKSLVAEYDQTWYAYPLWIAAAVEIDLGVVSILRLPPFAFSA
ncbi:hypothetical protein BDV95DRAFT_601355 [Massariosphaeria phaeospora]|uniref:Rhodopsin domain-containing protein n=1 Tax=Massariosphaeria phaeospora TaxID=100035 RepID=A0A7C8MJC3_9PLEO|nr:hypothetical protein BDV95DRAFT_601355 [Massariosphaeria phaeospora]